MSDPIERLESKKAELENLISEKTEQIQQRATNLKNEIEDRVNPEEIIRNNPVTSVGVSFGIGFVIGSIIKRSSKSDNHTTKSAQNHPKNYSEKNLSRFISEFTYDVFDAFKDLAIGALVDYASTKFSDVSSSENKNGMDEVNK